MWTAGRSQPQQRNEGAHELLATWHNLQPINSQIQISFLKF